MATFKKEGFGLFHFYSPFLYSKNCRGELNQMFSRKCVMATSPEC
ncbi:hypothetical protein T07_8489 [Trichinella nelsoni]|uniref:Uncharacterized protein n=1 Tax=Trichinella nelsoni TaxID=6336 RepID=A0A0V0RCG3_9BILA|nr:hypothetical protein T07_8489 [Trichinella nelsoni]